MDISRCSSIKKIILSIAIFSFAIVPIAGLVGAHDVQAATLTANDLWGNDTIEGEVTGQIGLGKRDPRTIIGAVIRVVLGFLGIIAVLIILAGGFKYMTAGGAEDKVEEAKKLMISGVIGLVIVLASFGLATFIMDAMVTATGATSS